MMRTRRSRADDGEPRGAGQGGEARYRDLSGGGVSLRSEPGLGTTVRLFLPRPEVVAAGPEAEVAARVGGTS